MLINGSGLVISGTDSALDVAYNPSTPTNWPIVPSTVQQALDDLAASSGLTIPETVVSMAFSYATSYPLTLQTVTSSQIINVSKIIITTPFSAGATLALGTSYSSALIFSQYDLNAQAADCYVNEMLITFSGSTSIILSGTMSGATQGAGIVLYKIR